MRHHFEEIGLLLPEIKTKTTFQDTLVHAPNICLHPLPLGGKRRGYFQRKKQIELMCRKVSPHYDVLLIRGITPRQWTVWKGCAVQKKAFLLVGSLLENRPGFGFSFSKISTWVRRRVRLREFKKICPGGMMLANSPQLVQEIKAFSGQTAQFIPTNTLSFAQIKPLGLHQIGHPVQLLFCGRVVQDKGIEELITGLGILNRSESAAYQLRIVGSVDKGYKTFLEKLAQQHGVAQYLIWEGFVPFGEKLLNFYQAADFLVLPSYHEGFPHSIWEAGAMSLPVITTKVGGIPGLVDETMLSFVEKQSAPAIAAKINYLQKTASTRWEKVGNLHQHSQHFSVEAAATQLKNFLATT